LATTLEHAYRYSGESACTLDSERADLRLFTSQPHARSIRRDVPSGPAALRGVQRDAIAPRLREALELDAALAAARSGTWMARTT
jgi:hypothetical protein